MGFDFGQDLPLLIGLIVAILVAMVVAAAETALLRLSPVRAASLAAAGSSRARRARNLIDDIPRTLSTILLVALLSQIGAATITGVLADRWFGSVGITVASILLTLVLFVYAEAIPKTFAVRHADTVALALSWPVSLLIGALRPVVAGLVWVADLQMPGKGITTSPTITEDELRRLASRAAREGEIELSDAMLIERAFRFGDRRCADIMVPRPDIVAVSVDDTVQHAFRVALDAGHRRLPVSRGSIEDIVGVVGLRQLAGVPADTRSSLTVESLAQPVPAVPESKRIFELLEDMQESNTHLAVVVDEYGGTAGLVTIEDIAEELLGSLDPRAESVVQVADDVWSVPGRLPVRDLAELLGVSLPERDWNTVAGLVLGLAGRLPQLGDEVVIDGHVLRVASIRRRRIIRVEAAKTSG